MSGDPSWMLESLDALARLPLKESSMHRCGATATTAAPLALRVAVMAADINTSSLGHIGASACKSPLPDEREAVRRALCTPSARASRCAAPTSGAARRDMDLNCGPAQSS